MTAVGVGGGGEHEVGQHELGIAHINHAELRMQGREGIVGDPGPGTRDRRDEARFTGIGQTQQADVGQQLQFQREPSLLTASQGKSVTGRESTARSR